VGDEIDPWAPLYFKGVRIWWDCEIAMASAPRDLLAAKINEICQWYELNKPEGGQRIEIAAAPKQIARALGLDCAEGQREFAWHNRTIVSIGKWS